MFTSKHHLGCGRMTLGAAMACAAWLVAAAGDARACSVPVFRYALDRWQADAYQLAVPAAVAKSAEIAPLLAELRKNPVLNLLATEDKSATSDGPARLLLPQAPDKPIWSGPLTADVFRALTDSPARRELAKRILAGESAVWVLVESGKRAADDAAAAAIEKRLKYIESVAALPEIDPNDPSSQVGPGPALKAKFSMLRVARTDPAEKFFVAMLTWALAEKSDAAGAPVVAPVFGRGKVLGVAPAGEVSDETVDEMCMFLLGACSCQAKEANPGYDLLMAVDWDAKLMEAQEAREKAAETAGAATEAKASVSNTNAPAPETVVITGAEPKAAPPPKDQSRLVGWLVAVVLLGFGAMIAGLSRRKKP
ncbi:MAG: hypothetical protein HZA91_00880 [Verrucomicrobia bacterium]|nr:hypothetical protein [Verrucomicrobiota bacterium]